MNAPSPAGSWESPGWGRLIAVTVLLGVMSWGGVELTRQGGNVASLWLADGALLGILLTTRTRQWPAYFAAAYIANCAANRLYGDSTLVAMILPLCNAAATLLAARVLNARLPEASDLTQRDPFINFLVFGVVLAPLLSAALGAAALYFTLGVPFDAVFGTWYLAVALGTAIVTPLMLQIRRRELSALFRREALGRTMALLTLMTVSTIIVFVQVKYPLLFLLCPMLMLVVSQLGFAGAAVSVCLTAIVAVIATLEGRGPVVLLAGLDVTHQIAYIQVFIAAMVAMTLPVAVTLSERERLRVELERANVVLRSLAMTDSLTGLANRRYFDDMLEREWRRAARGTDVLSLLLVDIDHFKLYNDYYGHPAGDRCLKTVAQALKVAACRSADIIARYGGEEFAVILPETPPEGAQAIAEALRVAVERLNIEHVKSEAGRLTISVGYASATGSLEERSAALVERADRALYAAKSEGRNRVIAAKEG